MRGWPPRSSAREKKRWDTRGLTANNDQSVVLKASADHAVTESQRPFVITAKDFHVQRAEGWRVDAESARSTGNSFQTRQWWTEDSRCKQDAYSRVQPAGGDSREVCSTAQMSAEVRLHSEGCRESIRQAMVDETLAAKSQSDRSLESYLKWAAQTRRLKDHHTRDCEGCDVAGSNREHR